ncbi:hypothetical protein ONZ45_g16857 [Pleurotus djamor]|nr:hypothetical protein ONZ45_g16857 [Pleurotus djamor]
MSVMTHRDLETYWKLELEVSSLHDRATNHRGFQFEALRLRAWPASRNASLLDRATNHLIERCLGHRLRTYLPSTFARTFSRREGNLYNPEKVKNFLKETVSHRQVPLLIVDHCFSHVNYWPELGHTSILIADITHHRSSVDQVLALELLVDDPAAGANIRQNLQVRHPTYAPREQLLQPQEGQELLQRRHGAAINHPTRLRPLSNVVSLSWGHIPFAVTITMHHSLMFVDEIIFPTTPIPMTYLSRTKLSLSRLRLRFAMIILQPPPASLCCSPSVPVYFNIPTFTSAIRGPP